MEPNIDTLMSFAAREYVRVLRQRPAITLLLTAGFAATVSILAYLDQTQRATEEAQRRATLASYSDQLKQLSTVQDSLKSLSGFVMQQKSRLEESERLLTSLQEEKRRLEPLVQADRHVIEAVLQLQEQRVAASVWRERLIGFGLGVAASLLASFLYAAAVYLWRSKRNVAGT